MSRLRHGMRRTVLVGASLLRDAGAGVRDAVSELSAAQGQSAQLERELELARQQGRWLSDDERAELLIQDQRRAQRRRTLLLLAVASLLIPPLWPLLPIWMGLLWWPVTTRRVIVVLLAGASAVVALLVVLLVWLLLR
ncbi:hypothetical protein [Synechococcus sp. CB0101]|uniref:hypothetical protein n=1 Tax=Synechococcus sp. CB0101 TaxID=232348 RepID=UPI001FED4DAD|nr:hypothetical protein [Synechococcus sp. CB0101]